MPHQLKVWVPNQVGNVILRAAIKVIHAKHIIAIVEHALTQMGTKKACAPSDQYSFTVCDFHFFLFYEKFLTTLNICFFIPSIILD
jgi:hypothetical protein